MYKIIIFDIDETLLDFKRAEKESFYQVLGEYGLEKTEKNFLLYKSINKKLWDQVEKLLIEPKDIKYKRFEVFLDEIGKKIDYIEFTKKYMDILSGKSYVYEGVEGLMKSLYKNYKLIAITNGIKEVHRKRIENSTIGRYFQRIIVSDEVGYSKPSKEIFNIALQGEKIENKNILIVGDSYKSDILGGINYGIDTFFINKNNNNIDDPRITYMRRDILELKEVLKEV